MTGRRLVAAVAVSVATAALLLGFRSLFHGDRIRFERALQAGMSTAQIEAAVGIPDEVLKPGQSLVKWGNVETHPVALESWVYYVSPKSQHRMVLEIVDGRMATLRHDQN
jgi:hypothetical protein